MTCHNTNTYANADRQADRHINTYNGAKRRQNNGKKSCTLVCLSIKTNIKTEKKNVNKMQRDQKWIRIRQQKKTHTRTQKASGRQTPSDWTTSFGIHETARIWFDYVVYIREYTREQFKIHAKCHVTALQSAIWEQKRGYISTYMRKTNKNTHKNDDKM